MLAKVSAVSLHDLNSTYPDVVKQRVVWVAMLSSTVLLAAIAGPLAGVISNVEPRRTTSGDIVNVRMNPVCDLFSLELGARRGTLGPVCTGSLGAKIDTCFTFYSLYLF